MEWHPINTIPRTGERVLGANPERDYLALGFMNAQGEFEEVDRIGTPLGVGFYPTHWLHIPQPPRS